MAVVNWTDAETFQLINCWAEEGIQEQLEGCKRNKHIYESLSRSLAEHSIEKTGEQCRTKVKKLRQDYKKIKDKQNLTGHGRSDWKYFDKLDKILGARPATRPPVLLETLDSQPLLHSEHDSDETDVDGYQEESNSQEHDNYAGDVSENQNSSSSAASVSGSPPPQTVSTSSTREESDEISVPGKVGIKGKKRKQN